MSKPASNNVRVFYRIYPMEKTEWGHLKLEDKTILMRHLQELSSLNHKVKPPTFWEFKTDGIFYNNDQQYVYVNVIDGVLDSLNFVFSLYKIDKNGHMETQFNVFRVVEGNNAIIIAFGQTRTGKTITLGGLQLSEEDFGITPRVIYDLFKIKSELPKNVKMCIQISCTEFSNTTAADLLKDYPFFVNYYRCRESTKIKVRSEYEALKVIFKGEGRKSFAFNSEYLSNLCSTVVTFHITTADTDFSSPRKVQSRLHIIDMAGVDTVGNTSSIYKYPPDIGKANIIKTNLEQFVLTLKKNVPFYTRLKERTNPLIYYLGNDLSNESIFRFIGHIKTPKENSMITISMLRFGQLVRGLKPKQKEIVSQVNENVQVQYLQNKLEKLEQQNVHNSVLLNQDLTQDMNKDRLEHVQRIIKEYLRDRVNEITVLNVAEAAEVFKVFKQICIERESERNKWCEEAQSELSRAKRSSKTSSKSSLLKASKGSTKKFSKKSKESVITSDKLHSTEKLASALSIDTRRTASGKIPSKRSSINGSQTNKRGSLSLSNKRSSVSRRRSTTSNSIADRRESKNNEPILLPDVIPDYPEAWSSFEMDNDIFYNTLLDEYKANENEIKSVYSDYVTEMKKLQCCKEIFEKRKYEVLEAQMIKQFHILETLDSSEDQLVMNNSEKFSQENYNRAQEELIAQQELVLKLQSEIKICLGKRQDIKKELNDEFDAYCKEKFSVCIPSLAEDETVFQETTASINIEMVRKEEEEDERCVQKEAKLVGLDDLKKIMQKELLRMMKIKAKERNVWKNCTLKI